MYTQKIKMSSVPESNAFRNMDFLIRLGSVKQQIERKEMLEVLTTEQLPGIGDVARCVKIGANSRKGTSRQRSGKGAIRKRFPLQKPRWEKNQTNNQVLIP